MTMQGSGEHRHSTLMRVTAITWLLLISAVAVIDHAVLSGLSAQVEASAPGLRVTALEQRLTALTPQVEQTTRQLQDALPQARYDAERVALARRLDAIDQALGTRPTAENLLPLQARIEQLEGRLKAPRPTPNVVTHARISAPVKPRTAEPPPRVIGAELRAGEQFLSILPADADALSQVRLLRPGEALSGWHLESIDGSTAVFRHGDDRRRLPIPAR